MCVPAANKDCARVASCCHHTCSRVHGIERNSRANATDSIYLLRLASARTGRALGAPAVGVMLKMLLVCGCALNWNAFGTDATAVGAPNANG